MSKGILQNGTKVHGNTGYKRSKETRELMSKALKGRVSPMKGKHMSNEHKRKLGLAHIGNKNPLWKGNNVGYSAIHRWVRWHKGNAIKCSWCGFESSNHYMIDWANIDHRYKRDLNDYISLCRKCHRLHDMDIFTKSKKYRLS
jgi:hypothetical protein